MMTERRITIVDQSMEKFLAFLLAQARIKRDNAAYGGAMNDGGASQIENEVEVYRAALERKTPPCWEGFLREFNRQHDPEYETYLRLQQKFGDK
jgi:hypothetical protein